MVRRKDLPIGMGPKTEKMIEELEFHFHLNGHDLVRKMVGDLGQPETKRDFSEYCKNSRHRRIEKIVRIKGFKFREKEFETFVKIQWKCRIKGLSTFIKQLVYYNYEKYLGPIPD